MVIRSSTAYSRCHHPVDGRRPGRPRSASARKPTWPRLTPSSGAGAGRASSAARSSVPSPPKHDHQLAALAAAGSCATTVTSGRSSSAGLVGQHPHAHAGRGEPLGRGPHGAQRLGPAGVADEQHGRRPAHDGVTRSLRDGRRQPGRVQRRGAPAQPQEVLDVARRAGQRAGGHARPRPGRARRAPPRATVGDRLAPGAPARGRRRPRRARSRPTSNCGLTIGTRSASGVGAPRPAPAAPGAAR